MHKHLILKRFALFILLCSATLAVAQADTATQRLHAFFTDMRTLRADFDQVVLDANQKQLQAVQGTLMLQRPGRFRWDYITPYEQQLIGDGTKVWFYDTELAQVTVKQQDETLGGSPALLLSGDQPLEKTFTIVDDGSRDGVDWLALSPKMKDTEFTRLRLGFRGADLVSMELTDGFGQTTLLRFSHLQRNPALNADVFKFVVPEGVDVVGE